MQTKIKAYCIIEKVEKILLSKDIGATRWSLPGGGVKNSELVKDAATREVAEETGHQVKLTSLVCLQEYVKEDGQHVLRFYFSAEIIGGMENNQKDEIGELNWISKDKVKKLKEQDFALRPHYLAVTDYLNNKRIPLDRFQSLSR
jgi:8-oxo-dGTP diphosphatase